MDRSEEMIKNYLKKNLDLDSAERTPDCLNEQVLTGYLQGKLGPQQHKAVDYHIAGCGFCLSQLDIAHQAQLASGQDGFEPAPGELINKTKVSLGISASRAEPKPKPGLKRVFLALAIIFFALSFIIPKYFIQFLVATLILGLRWAFESEGGRSLIMVLDSRRHHSQDKDQETSNRLKNHI